MRYTLLEMVQQILSSMDSDEVNSINDTVESYQIARMLKTCFYDMATELGLKEHGGMLEINASGSASLPCVMTLPTAVTRLEWIKYDNKLSTETHQNFQPVLFVEFDDFLNRQQSLRLESSTTVGSQTVTENGETFNLLYRKDKMPQYFTTVDGTNLYFDSLKTTEDTTLQKAKTLCYGFQYPTFTLSDAFYPDLDPLQFSLFMNKAKARAFQEYKQVQNPEAIKEARIQKIAYQKNSERTKNLSGIDLMPKYGRK